MKTHRDTEDSLLSYSSYLCIVSSLHGVVLSSERHLCCTAGRAEETQGRPETVSHFPEEFTSSKHSHASALVLIMRMRTPHAHV